MKSPQLKSSGKEHKMYQKKDYRTKLGPIDVCCPMADLMFTCPNPECIKGLISHQCPEVGYHCDRCKVKYLYLHQIDITPHTKQKTM